MKASLVDPNTGKLIYTDFPRPVLKANEVLIRNHASAVNRADLLQRAGKYAPPQGASEIIGLEAAGVVEQLGADVSDYKIGDRVFCLLTGGGYAQYVAVPQSLLMRIPAALSFEQAASIPEAFLTAYLNLFVEGSLVSGETVLVHAAASGVGMAAVQLSHAFGAKVLATAGSEEKCNFVKSLGAIECINYKQESFLEKIGESSVNLLLDMVGQKHFLNNLKVLKYRGRLVMLSLISGAKTEIDLFPVIRKNLTLKGSTLRDRSEDEKGRLTRMFEKEVLELFESGRVKPVICKTFLIEEAQAAHDFVEADLNLGKVVLRV